MEYKAYIKQSGEGCDYTIGCAQTVIDIEANSMGEAMIKLTETILEDYNYDEVFLESAEIYEINRIVDMSVEQIYATDRENKMLKNLAKQEEAEKEELARLMKKYENK